VDFYQILELLSCPSLARLWEEKDLKQYTLTALPHLLRFSVSLYHLSPSIIIVIEEKMDEGGKSQALGVHCLE
jgi:hypothetical protein